MTVEEIRERCMTLVGDRAQWEIALQLALGNERLERIATALENCKCHGQGAIRFETDQPWNDCDCGW